MGSSERRGSPASCLAIPRSRERAGDRARAATSLANWMVISGRPDEALMWAERAVDATDAGSALRAMARTAQAYAFGKAGRGHEGIAVLEFLPISANDVPMLETRRVDHPRHRQGLYR